MIFASRRKGSMAKIKIKGVKEVSDKLNRNIRIELNKILRDPALRQKVGQIVVDDIKANVDFGSSAPGTLKWRETYDQINATDPAYSRNKLNAVFTGELLEDLKNNVRAFPTELTFEIAHSDKRHKKYQGVTKMIGSRSKYSEISEGLVKGLGYDYFKLTKRAQSEITKLIREELFKLLANI
jgi:hypothetical protein